MNDTIDSASTLSYALGSAITVSASVVIVINCLVGYALVKNNFSKGPSASLYKLTLNLICADTLHIVFHAFYLGPASAMQSWLIPNSLSFLRRVPGIVASTAWKGILMILCALAVNRYVAVCKPNRYSEIFSVKRTNIAVAISWTAAVAVSIVSEFLLPCCGTYLYYKVYSFSQMGIGYNYNSTYLNLPTNAAASVFIVVVYGSVIRNIRVNNKKVADSISTLGAQKRRRREVWYAVQLIIENVVFLAVWILFQVLSRVLPTDKPNSGIFSIVVFVDIVKASTNSFVLIFLNQEVKNALRNSLPCFPKTNAISVGVTSIASPNLNMALS